jgi:hypothetical protein
MDANVFCDGLLKNITVFQLVSGKKCKSSYSETKIFVNRSTGKKLLILGTRLCDDFKNVQILKGHKITKNDHHKKLCHKFSEK